MHFQESPADILCQNTFKVDCISGVTLKFTNTSTLSRYCLEGTKLILRPRTGGAVCSSWLVTERGKKNIAFSLEQKNDRRHAGDSGSTIC